MKKKPSFALPCADSHTHLGYFRLLSQGLGAQGEPKQGPIERGLQIAPKHAQWRRLVGKGLFQMSACSAQPHPRLAGCGARQIGHMWVKSHHGVARH